MRLNTPLGPAAALAFSFFSTAAFSQLNITQLGHLDYQDIRNSDLSNIWGYADEEGNEYALVGVNGDNGQNNTGGFSVVDVTDPANPQEVFFTNGPNSIWREIKTYNNHAYVTTEAEAGLQIIDLSPLPQSTDLPVTLFIAPDWITSHSLFIDETNGRLYLNGSNRGNGGVIIYDLTQDPEAPVEIGEFDNWYVHDCYARGNLLYNAHISDGFMSIVDVTDPANPVLLGTQATPDNFTHNCWLDDSGQYIFTTDERPDSYLAAYDVSDPTDIQLLDQLQTSPGSEAVIHNTYWLNDYVVQSYYTEGVSIYDVSDPNNIVETGHYDTSPFVGDGFNGAWGVYPFAPSGRLYVSDIEQGLFILGPTYVRGCYLEGLISDEQSSAPVNSATLTLTGTTAFDVTGFDGLYSTGFGVAGTYAVLVQAPGYLDETVTGVVLTNGEITLLDVQLTPLVSFTFTGTVVEEGTNAPVPGAEVFLQNVSYEYTTTTDGSGAFSIPGVFNGDYDIVAGKWGYHTTCVNALEVAQGMTPPQLVLPVGYADDFALDLGWTVTGTAENGQWERGIPQGTTFGNAPSNPGEDVEGDCSGYAYVTGNDGGQAGDDDVDNGFTTLTSPVFDATGDVDPWVSYYRWWFNDGGQGGMNDAMTIQLSNGTETVTLETINNTDPDDQTWVLHQSAIVPAITPTATMRLIVRTADDAPGHLVEAGIDRFELLPHSPFDGLAEINGAGYAIFPVPSDAGFTVVAPVQAGIVHVLDAAGREVIAAKRLNGGRVVVDETLTTGVYLVRIEGEGIPARTMRAVVR